MIYLLCERILRNSRNGCFCAVANEKSGRQSYKNGLFEYDPLRHVRGNSGPYSIGAKPATVIRKIQEPGVDVNMITSIFYFSRNHQSFYSSHGLPLAFVIFRPNTIRPCTFFRI